ncbi:MAG: c-type cytochrome [Gammaproteobacteria bacterium]|nr:c-type cytochrome [Gammaproteobacteria bacterium]
MKSKLLSFWLLFMVSPLLWSATHRPQDFLDKITGSKTEGQSIVKHYCISCHATHPMIPLGAPRIGHTKDWAPRLKQSQKELWQHVDEGFRAMPARGGCFECSDEQLKQAIAILIEPAQ